ncbi:uncharacterized protein [Dermacentor albipictus]|uniref:uncharacterized protein n=1 Tax=Dermacentor albipictus TaxID=60249 RepID=UPI0031FD64CB
MYYASSETVSGAADKPWNENIEGVSLVGPTDTLCATAARRRNRQRNGAKVRKLTPIPQKQGSRYRPVRVIEAEVMASVSEEDEQPFTELAQVRWSPVSPSSQRGHQHYYESTPVAGLTSSRKVQYCRRPEVHEYTKESSGSYVGARLDCKIHADGTIVNLGPDQAASLLAARAGDVGKAADFGLSNAAMMAAGTRAAAAAFDAVACSPPRESNIITVLEQTKGGQQQQVLQVIEDCSCFDQESKAEPSPQPQVQTSPCRECLDEMLYYGHEHDRAVSNTSGAKSPAQVRVMQEAALYETNDDRFRSVQVKQEHIHGMVQEEARATPMPRSIESNHGAAAEPAIRIIHEERLIDPNSPQMKQEPSAVRVQTPKEALSATAAAAPGATGKEEPRHEAVMDPSIVPVKSLSGVHIIQDFPKFDVPASVRIIHSTASANSARPSSVRLGQDVLPKAIPVPYEPLHVLKEERRFEAVNLIKDERSDSHPQLSKQERKGDHGSESPTQGKESRPSSGRELGRQLSHSHVHHTSSNNSRALVPYEDCINDDDRQGPRRPGREPGRSIHIQSRRRPAGLHINLEGPELAPSPSPDRTRREKSTLDKLRDRKTSDRHVISRSPFPFDPQLRPPEVPPINTRSAPMEEVARHAWKQYSREYQRYLSNLAEWNQQQQMLRNQLGNLGSDSTGAGSEVGQSLASQKADMDEEPMHVRITLSGNSLGRGRAGTAPGPSMSPMGSPRGELPSKHTVCTESISLIETFEPPDPPRCSSHIEANRQRKARAAEEAELEASFEERPDRRVHMTPLCTEHMSYRAFSSNSPNTRPPPKAPPPRGTPMSRLVPVMPITKHYMERIDFPDNLEPPRRQIPTRKIRRHVVYPVFPQLQMGIPRDFLVYFLVSMATLASIFAAIGVFSKHEHSLSERVTQNAPVAVPLPNGSNSLFIGLNRRAMPMNNLDVCKNADCQREGRYLASQLSWAVEPCSDFYAFVCNRPGPAPLEVLERNAASELRRKSPKKEIMPLKQLHDRCMKVDGRNWNQLQAAFALLSLDGWPFQDSHNLSHDLIWEVAAGLERRIGVSSLLSVSVQPRSNVVVLAKTKIWPESKDKLMEAHFTKYAKALRPASENLEERVAEVLSFARKLESLQDHQPNERSRSNASPYSHFISLLGLGEDQREVLFSKQLASQLKQEVNGVAPHIALNYQGLLAAEKMSPLLPDASASEEGCWRLVQDALPELFLYAVYRMKKSALKQSANVTESIRNNVVLYVNSASWMEATVRRQVAERLRDLRVLAFVPGWFSNAERVRTEFAGLPHPSMDNGPLAYVALKEHTHGRLLRGKAWPIPPHSSQCAFDDTRRTVYVPVLATNLTNVQSAPLQLARLPRLGVHLAACLMHVVTAEAAHWWGERSLRKLEPLRKCVDSQSAVANQSSRDILLDHMAALAPAHSVYSSRLREGGARNQEYRLKHAENITTEQMFFIHFAKAQCHGPAQLVNVPLKNYEPFRRAFGCHPGARMSPAKTCRFWTS